MNKNKIAETIEATWRNEIRTAYINGVICSERHLQAEMYYHLKTALPNSQLWIEPTFELGSGRNKWKIKPDILITDKNKICCIIELKYVPYKEVRFKDDIEKMYSLEKNDKKESFRLKTNSKTGEYTDDLFYVSKDLLCVFAAVALGDYAWGVKNRTFWQEKNCDVKIPKNFLHLAGRVYGRNGDTREPEFVNADID